VAKVVVDLLETVEVEAIEKRILHRALHDPLTAVPDRVLFLDRLESALSRLERRADSPRSRSSGARAERGPVRPASAP
jgi:GGDEF domain-containing protein